MSRSGPLDRLLSICCSSEEAPLRYGERLSGRGTGMRFSSFRFLRRYKKMPVSAAPTKKKLTGRTVDNAIFFVVAPWLDEEFSSLLLGVGCVAAEVLSEAVVSVELAEGVKPFVVVHEVISK